MDGKKFAILALVIKSFAKELEKKSFEKWCKK